MGNFAIDSERLDAEQYVHYRTVELHEIMELIDLLGSHDGVKRHTARVLLVEMGEKAVGPLMIKLTLGHDQERWEASKALGQIGTISVAKPLVCALEDSMYGVRWLAAEGLIGLGRKGLPALMWALVRNPDSWWLREGAHHVLYTLRRMGIKQPVEPVLTALDQSIPPAHEAMKALRELGEEVPRNLTDEHLQR